MLITCSNFMDLDHQDRYKYVESVYHLTNFVCGPNFSIGFQGMAKHVPILSIGDAQGGMDVLSYVVDLMQICVKEVNTLQKSTREVLCLPGRKTLVTLHLSLAETTG